MARINSKIRKSEKPGTKKRMAKKELPASSERGSSGSRFPVVGIGASAGGLEAFSELLKALPDNTGMAFIFIQHFDPTHKSITSEILSRITQMPVQEVKDSMPVLPDHVYVIPSNADMTIVHGVLNLMPRTESHGRHLIVDSFFHSLAKDQKARSIGVVLSGTASDGTEGLKAIKAEGGLVIVQDPKTAKHHDMPSHAIASQAVDLILSPTEIAKEIIRIGTHPYIAAACEETSRTEPEVDNLEEKNGQDGSAAVLRKIFVLLQTHTHVDFSNYKQTTVKRRIERRMMVRKISDLKAYAKYLHDHLEEINALHSDILIHVTEFFRDPDSFKVLRGQVFSQLIKGKVAGTTLRVWVPGCSTGEEAYSLAIALIEFLGETSKFRIQIFATDVSESTIQKAREGTFSDSIVRNVSKGRLQRFFEKVEGGYKIQKSIRDLCLFSKHDVTRDTPFSKLDLVSCRNLLIYFSADLQRQVIPIFHYALNPGGFLWLGRAENVGGFPKLFTQIDKTHKIYLRANTRSPMIHFPVSAYIPEVQKQFKKISIAESSTDFQKEADKIAFSKYLPPSVVVNSSMDILQFRGRTASYLEPADGVPSNNLFRMIKEEFQDSLSEAVEVAKKKNKSVRKEILSRDHGDLTIEVIPINPLAPSRNRNFLISFCEAVSTSGSVEKAKKSSGTHRPKKGIHQDARSQNSRIRQLEHQLAANKSTQRLTTEEFQATQEELTSANEELQSTNEELQSTNEELGTAKEELQSSNEELTTVNDELQSRNADLVILSSDLTNLLSSVDIPILMVGNDHRIRKFTPKAEKVFKLIPSDVGRPIEDIKSTIDLDLDPLISEVVDSLMPLEREIQDHKGRWMRLQIRPYKTIDNRIDGAVIALVDIEELKERIDVSEKAQDYLTSVADSVHLPLVILDKQLHLVSANRAFSEHFKISPLPIGKDFFGSPELTSCDSQELRDRLRETLNSKRGFAEMEIDCEFSHLGPLSLKISANVIQWKGAVRQENPSLLVSLTDTTEQKRLETALAAERHKIETIFQESPAAMALFQGPELILEKINPQFQSLFGDRNLLGLPILEALPELESQSFPSLLQWVLETGEPSIGEEVLVKIVRSQGGPMEDRYFNYSYIAVSDSKRKRYGVYFHAVDVTEKVLARRKLEESQKLLEVANNTKDAFLATLSHELRTPLASILSWSQLIQRQNFDHDKLMHAIDTIEQAAKIQGQLIDDLVDVSRIQSGKLSINFIDVDLRDPVNRAIEAVRILAESKNLIIEKEMNAGPRKISGDPERLQQIVWNLLTNAIKFSSNGGKIQVRVEPAMEQGRHWLSLHVIDQGKGIESDFLNKIFDRFTQADSSSVRIHGGLGLGLSIVRDLVQLQGGRIRAQSEGLGKGSYFTALFPLLSEMIEATKRSIDSTKEKEKTEMANLADLRVMIVEDDLKTLEVLIEAIQSFGAKTMGCHSAKEALDAFEEFKPDVLISDIAMPDEDGYSLIRKIRLLKPEKNGDVPALALTAYATAEEVKRCLSAGFHDHLAKPFDPFHLGHLIVKLAKK